MKRENFFSKNIKQEVLSGWGQTNKIKQNIFAPKTVSEIKNLIHNLPKNNFISRGLGRSYGDAAQLENQIVIKLNNFCKIEINKEEKTITAGAGVSFSELLKILVPLGYFLPVTAGTKNITLGGAIAADIHGKNHHIDGSFGNYIHELVIIDGKGEINKLSPTSDKREDRDYFWASIGGMGLTGIIIEATFSLISISTSFLKVDTKKFFSLKDLMKAMVEADKKYKYSVAWIDSLNNLGRGVLTCAEHAELNDLPREFTNPLLYDPKYLAKAPPIFPGGLLNKFTVGAFNEAWYRKSHMNKKDELQSISQFFYPLDGIDNWNNIYGSKGFLQYQFFIPDEADFMIEKTFSTLKEIKSYGFLTVLKRFGENNKGFISFPKKGWTLAIDIPAGKLQLYKTLDNLDQIITSHGGRLYLAKDSRMSASTFRACYSKFDKWLDVKKKVDPHNIFYSDLAKRLNI